MALDFKSHIFQAFAQVPSYSSWLLHEADASSTYAYERRVLQLLQWGEPTRPWRLKSPSHLLFIDQLSAAFPDARFVMTHRDVADVIVSVADLYQEVIKRLTDHVDPHYIGALNVEHWSVGMRRTVAFRRSNGDRFFDVDSRAMQTKPLDTVTELYEWLGEPVSAEFRSGMQRWWAENGKNRAPVVDRPEASFFGIDLDAVRTLFNG